MKDNNQPMSFKHKAKSALLFFGQSLLFCLGLTALIFTFVGLFEGSFSFAEMSLLEIIFTLVLVFLICRYLTASKASGLTWRRMLYLPLRNIGWFSLISYLFFIFFTLNEGADNLNVLLAKNANRMQWVDFIFIQLCLYWAAPKLPAEQSVVDDLAKEEAIQ